MSLRILHIAPFNTSGVPIAFVRAERELGHQSRLVTLALDRRGYQEDICLRLPFLDFWGTRLLKRLVSDPHKLRVDNRGKAVQDREPFWRPHSRAEALLVRLREHIWRPRLQSLFRNIDFWNFDVYQLDGGLEFYRDGRIVRRLKQLGKKIICCYTGSDLRTRGILPAVDEVSDLNVTLEFDHLRLYPKLQHVFFPFDVRVYPVRPEPEDEVVTIGHAPTNRAAKGSDEIVAAVRQLKAELPVELILIEGLTHAESLKQKARCHIFVDQIGELGYGVNSLESLAMGIPTCSCLVEGFEARYPDHPFVVVNRATLKSKLRQLVLNSALRQTLGRRGRDWVRRHHDARAVVRQIHELADLVDSAGDGQTQNSKPGRTGPEQVSLHTL